VPTAGFCACVAPVALYPAVHNLPRSCVRYLRCVHASLVLHSSVTFLPRTVLSIFLGCRSPLRRRWVLLLVNLLPCLPCGGQWHSLHFMKHPLGLPWWPFTTTYGLPSCACVRCRSFFTWMGLAGILLLPYEKRLADAMQCILKHAAWLTVCGLCCGLRQPSRWRVAGWLYAIYVAGQTHGAATLFGTPPHLLFAIHAPRCGAPFLPRTTHARPSDV